MRSVPGAQPVKCRPRPLGRCKLAALALQWQSRSQALDLCACTQGTTTDGRTPQQAQHGSARACSYRTSDRPEEPPRAGLRRAYPQHAAEPQRGVERTLPGTPVVSPCLVVSPQPAEPQLLSLPYCLPDGVTEAFTWHYRSGSHRPRSLQRSRESHAPSLKQLRLAIKAHRAFAPSLLRRITGASRRSTTRRSWDPGAGSDDSDQISKGIYSIEPFYPWGDLPRRIRSVKTKLASRRQGARDERRDWKLGRLALQRFTS